MAADTTRPRRKNTIAPEDRHDAGTAPMRFLDTYLAALLARASSLISDEFHATLARKKIPALQWRVLACLSDGPLPVGDLGRLIPAKQPTVSKLIDRMEALALVVRREDPASRRRTLVALTPKAAGSRRN